MEQFIECMYTTLPLVYSVGEWSSSSSCKDVKPGRKWRMNQGHSGRESIRAILFLTWRSSLCLIMAFHIGTLINARVSEHFRHTSLVLQWEEWTQSHPSILPLLSTFWRAPFVSYFSLLSLFPSHSSFSQIFLFLPSVFLFRIYRYLLPWMYHLDWLSGITWDG